MEKMKRRLLFLLLGLALVSAGHADINYYPSTSYPTSSYPAEASRANINYYPSISAGSTLTDGLVSWWQMDEESGTRVDAVTATGNDLTDTNTVLFTAGQVGNAAQFVAATTERLTRADNASLRVGTGDFTFSFWYRRDANVGALGAVLDKGKQGEYTFDDVAGTQMRFYTINGAAYPTALWGSALTLSQWYHVVGWRDGTALTVNIQLDNGTPVSTATGAIVSGDSAVAFSIGAFGDGASPTSSSMDLVGFWKRVLTADERTELQTPTAYPF